MEPFLFCLLVSAIVTRVPAAIVDAYAAKKAADAGEWDYLKDRAAARDARAQRRADWAERILARRRSKAAGVKPKRAGLGTLLGDVYHGVCEDALDRRTAKRAARAPAPTTPGLTGGTRRDRVTEWLREQTRKADADRRPAPTTPSTDSDKQVPVTPTPDVTAPVVRNCPRTDGHDPHVWGRGQLDCPGIVEHPQSDGPANSPTSKQSPNGAHRPTLPCGICDQPFDDHIATDLGGNEPALVCPRQNPETDPGGTDMTAPTSSSAVAEEVHTNEAARRNFEKIAEGAAELQEAAAMAEAARAKMAAAAQASVDGMAATRFDAGATSAAAEAADAVSTGTLSDWCEKAEAAGTAAKAGLKSLEKYRDAEDVVSNNNVDGRTLEPTASRRPRPLRHRHASPVACAGPNPTARPDLDSVNGEC